ncbi:MAG: type II toxin-antitoxin system VapC family toxin [Lentimonas sp.]
MTEAPLLDTHIWIWWLLGDSRLDKNKAEFLDQLPPDNRPRLCDISLWELALLVDRGRLELDCSLDEFLKTAAAPATVSLQSITPAIVTEMNRLPETFHRDPADRLIVATARNQKLALASHDQLIIGSQLIKIWNL